MCCYAQKPSKEIQKIDSLIVIADQFHLDLETEKLLQTTTENHPLQMDIQIQKITPPHYKKIYTDILNKKHPDKKEECKTLLDKENLSVLDVIKLNRIIFGFVDKETESFNQKHRSYTKSDILQILNHQKKYNLNNTQLALHFKLSRNTVTKWKKMFLVYNN